MASTEKRLAESRRLSQMLVSVAERSKADFAASADRHGLPVHLARALLYLDEPVPMGELACSLTCDPSYITALADQLEERGLVKRVPGDDRRVKLLALTAAGRKTRDKLAEAVNRESLVLRRLSDAERAVLAPLLERLASDELA